jgi:hypothetical protein
MNVDSENLFIFEKFTLICNVCNSKNIEKEDSRCYSETSGSWGSLDLVCLDCGNREVIDGDY